MKQRLVECETLTQCLWSTTGKAGWWRWVICGDVVPGITNTAGFSGTHRNILWTFRTLCGCHKAPLFGGVNKRGVNIWILTHNIYLQRVAVLIKGQVIVIYRVFASCLIIQLHQCCRKSSAWSISSSCCWRSPFPHAATAWTQGFTPKAPWEYLIYQKVLVRHLLLEAQTSQTSDKVSYPLKLCHAV